MGAHVLLTVLLGSALSMLLSPGESALVVLMRAAVMSACSVAFLPPLTGQGGRQLRRLCDVRETLRGTSGPRPRRERPTTT
ncbi:hypothetical protein BU52_16680 [Streptomyces toyocaensis]|uniref:Uncharacterized protein n=1 Tax=Streptomyces toyocaensis TaxID=55952 RepID=A0A081XR82_STRTO|nr:hypothetical protein BU52_16680 [Streptomyces toyocaensis]